MEKNTGEEEKRDEEEMEERVGGKSRGEEEKGDEEGMGGAGREKTQAKREER